MKKCLLAVAVLLGGSLSLFADGLKAGVDIDFTDYLAQQSATSTNGPNSWSDITVRRSPWYTGDTFGRQDLYFKYDSDSWNFYTSFRFDQGTTSLGQAHVQVNLDDGVFKLRTGYYQEESFGYGESTFAAGPMGRYLAAADLNTSYLFTWRSDSQYLTSVEFTPDEPSGLSVLVGVPIEPHGTYSNVTPTSSGTSRSALWYTTFERFKLAAKYDLPSGGTLRLTFQNDLFSNQATSTSSDTDQRESAYIQDLTKGIEDGFIGLDNYSPIDGVTVKVGLDVQYDMSLFGQPIQNQIYLSGGWDITSNIRVTLDNVFTMATPDWFNANFLPGTDTSEVYPYVASGWIFYDTAVAKASYTIDPFTLSVALNGGYEPTTNGHMYVYGQAYTAAVNSGSNGSAYCIGLNPMATMKLGAGSLGTGIDLGFLSNTGSVNGVNQTNTAFGWRIPVDYKLSL